MYIVNQVIDASFQEYVIKVILSFQIWNINAALQSKATVLKKVHSLLPDINFLGEFYKGKFYYFLFFFLVRKLQNDIVYFLEHQSNHAYGRR